MNAGLITSMVADRHGYILALLLTLLIGLAGLSGSWVASELASSAPQAVADACQGGGGGC